MNKTEALTSKVSKQKGKRHSSNSKNRWNCYVCDEDRNSRHETIFFM